MIIKTPVCYDTSHWRTVPNFAEVTPRPFLVITKATEGETYVDPTFVPYFLDLAQDGIHRGAFHFHRKTSNPVTQARHFCNTVRPYLINKDLVILDVEEGGESAAALVAWFEIVMADFPDNLPVIYSRKNILDPIPMNAAQRAFFRQYIKTWTAGYPYFPDLYNEPPASYIPDQTKYGPVIVWQYTDRAPVAGIEPPRVDANWLSPLLVALLGGTPTPNPEPIPFGYTALRRYGSNAYIVKLERFERAHVTNTQGVLTPVSAAASIRGATYAINGDGWTGTPKRPLSLAASDAQVYQAEQYDFRPFINIGPTNGIEIDHQNQVLWNTVSGTRYLVQNGRNVFAGSTDPEHVTERHPRSAVGYTAGQHLILCVVDGRSQASQGVTLKELAQILIEAGASWALELDGGGSSALWVNDRIVNIPSDGAERAVINHLLIWTEETTMQNGTAREALGNTSTIRQTPSRYGTDTGRRVSPNQTIEFVEVVPAQVQGSADNPNDQWFELPDGSFVNYILSGRSYYTILTQPENPEPEPEPGLPAAWDVVQTAKDDQGNVIAIYRGTLTRQ